MDNYEIEKKFLVKSLPADLDIYQCHHITQGYLCRRPAVRVRREDDVCYLTYKGIRTPGVLAQEEYNLALTSEACSHLMEKADGAVIRKKRYVIPMEDGPEGRVIELDVFEGEFEGLVVAEVEFDSEDEAAGFVPPGWFGDEVTSDMHYSNAWLSENAPIWREYCLPLA